MSLIGYADLDRPVTFASGRIYHAFGGGPFRLEPSGCAIATTADGALDLRLDLVRALNDADSRAWLSLGLTPRFDSPAALTAVRAIDPAATLAPCVLTDWIFRLPSTPGLRIPTELADPVALAPNGLGSARLATELTLESGQILEAMLRERTPLAGYAVAQLEGVSPRVPVVVRFDAARLLAPLIAQADAAGTLPRDAIAAWFARDPAALPMSLSDAVSDDMRASFGEAMADRVIARFGAYVPAGAGDTGLRARLQAPDGVTTLAWALLQPVAGRRQVSLRIDLLADAQAQAARAGIDSIVHRDTLTSPPALGRTRITALCNLPTPRSGVDALGVNLEFPPNLPYRPQPRSATLTFEPPDDLASADVALAPGERACYRYSTFAVVSDGLGTREIDSAPVDACGSPLRLAPDQFPVDFAMVEATPALAQLARICGTVTCDTPSGPLARAFTLDSGSRTAALAVPRQRSSLRIDAVAVARDGSGTLPLGPYDTLSLQLDVTSFASYGPREAQLRCVFDDTSALRAMSLLPDGLEDADANITTISFTPAESARTFRWFAGSPFHAGFRYRAYDPQGGAWSAASGAGSLVVYSSQLKRNEAMREVAAKSGKALRESAPVRLGRQLETAEAQEAAPQPVAASPAPEPRDDLVYTGIPDAGRKYYVPRYALDVQAVSGQQRYRIAMVQGATTSTLEVNLVASIAPAIADAARDAAEYPHTVKILLEYLVAPPAGATKSLEFTDLTRNGANVRAVLTFATLQERDEVYRALTESARQARLVVQRFIDVSVPQPVAPAPGTPPRQLLPVRPIAAISMALAQPLTLAAPVAAIAARPALAARAALAPEALAVGRRTEAAAVALALPVALASPVLAMRPVGIATVPRPVPVFVAKLPRPQLAFVGMHQDAAGTRITLSLTNWAEYPDDFFAPADDLRAGGGRRVATRTWIDVKDADSKTALYNFCAIPSPAQLCAISFTLPPATAVPRQLYVTLVDRRTNVTRDSNPVAVAAPTPPAPPMLATRSELDQVVEPMPFTFPPALHGYIFQGLAAPGGESGLVRFRLPWHDVFHTYLQDASHPSVVYCFPDSFKIARRGEAPFTPFASVRVNTHPDGGGTDVVFDYVVAPYTDARRLEDARTQLLANAGFGAKDVEFEPFATSDVRYYVDRPTHAGSVREQRGDAALVLQGALKDTLTMALDDFQVLYDAMQRKTAALFMGHVDIDVPHGDTEVIPFQARMDDLAGEIFSYDATAAQDGSFQVTVLNAIESPVDVQTLDATFTAAGQRVPGTIRPGAVPRVGLAPGASLVLAVTPAAALPAHASPEVGFDLSGVTVSPDAQAIWTAILDRSTTEYFRVVTVRAIPSLFDPVQGREDERIAAIVVAFEGGGTAELTATAPSAQVRVDYSIDDVILKRPVSDEYRYSVTVVRANGTQDVDSQPRQQSAQVFYVSVVR